MTRFSSARASRVLLLAVATVALLCLTATAPARADTVPPLVVKNLKAVTELMYKLENPLPNSNAYPSCHRTCVKLYRELVEDDDFEAWDEIHWLGGSAGPRAARGGA